MFVSATSSVVLFMNSFVLIFFNIYYYISSLLARVAANLYSVFMLPVGLCDRRQQM